MRRTEATTKQVTALILSIFLSWALYGCAATKHTGQETIETVEVIADAKEKIGEEASRLKGLKNIQAQNEGCSDVYVRGIDGTIYGKIPAKSGALLKIKIGILSDNDSEFTLQANHIDPTPPGCDDRGVDFADFDQDTDSDDWRIRLR